MKTNRTTIAILLTLGSFTLPMSQAFAVGGVVNNGGDSVTVGDTVKMFDEIECSDAFSPDLSTDPAISEAFHIISTRLTTVQTKLPTTGTYLRSVFSSGTALWCFVNAELKEVADEGPTSLVVSFEHQQIAVNQRGVIKIRADLWQQMNATSRATLLVHEALWTAVGPEYLWSGAQIRQLTNLFMAPSLANFTAGNLGRFIKQFIGDRGASSKLVGLVDYDLTSAGGLTNYLVAEVVGSRSVDTVITIKQAGHAMNGKRLTALNPNPLFPYVWMSRDHQLWTDIGLTPGSNNSVKMNWQLVKSVSSLCDRMYYGVESGWRLPTTKELQSLIDLEMPRWSYVPVTRVSRTLSDTAGFSYAISRQSPYLFPTESALDVITSEYRILNLANNLNDVTNLHSAASLTAKMAPAEYPNYLCIHD